MTNIPANVRVGCQNSTNEGQYNRQKVLQLRYLIFVRHLGCSTASSDRQL